MIAGPVEATAIGNVLVQARAHGNLGGDLDTLRARASHPGFGPLRTAHEGAHRMKTARVRTVRGAYA